jgi:hypothetical protein
LVSTTNASPVVVTPSARPTSCSSSASTGRSAEPGVPTSLPRGEFSDESSIRNCTFLPLNASRTLVRAAAARVETASPSAADTSTMAGLAL